MTTFGLEVTPDWKTFLKFIQICRIGCPFGWSEPIFAQLMTCNSWQTNKTKVLWKRCLPRADPKNFEQRGEVFLQQESRESNTRVLYWIFKNFWKQKLDRGKGKLCCHIQFQTDFLAAQTDLLCTSTQVTKKNSDQNKSLLIGFESNSIMSCGSWSPN